MGTKPDKEVKKCVCCFVCEHYLDCGVAQATVDYVLPMARINQRALFFVELNTMVAEKCKIFQSAV
jgi:hypothetical protein